jgi:LysM repeat protein
MDRFRAAVNKARGGGSGPVKTNPTKPAPSTDDTYVVRPGDSWWSITERTLGDPSTNWRALAAANGGPDRELHPGDVLTIPGAPDRPTTGPTHPTMPDYPGQAERGDRGPIVLTWQVALIDHGVISDNADNRDSHYGDGMYKAVLRLQRSWDWSDADGVAGRHTWTKLHGGR